MSVLRTFTGRIVDVRNLVPSAIDIRDIAHTLSFIPRYGGRIKTFYSVAQHCVLMSYLVPEKDALYALLHDSTESILADLSRNIKLLLPDYRKLERELHAFIMNQFKLSENIPESVEEADLRICVTERRDVVKPEWIWYSNKLWGVPENTQPYNHIKIKPWTQKYAKYRFLRRIRELNGTYFPTQWDRIRNTFVKAWGTLLFWHKDRIKINC